MVLVLDNNSCFCHRQSFNLHVNCYHLWVKPRWVTRPPSQSISVRFKQVYSHKITTRFCLFPDFLKPGAPLSQRVGPTCMNSGSCWSQLHNQKCNQTCSFYSFSTQRPNRPHLLCLPPSPAPPWLPESNHARRLSPRIGQRRSPRPTDPSGRPQWVSACIVAPSQTHRYARECSHVSFTRQQFTSTTNTVGHKFTGKNVLMSMCGRTEVHTHVGRLKALCRQL